MREILFRGKEKDQWVSGYYWKYEQNGKEFHVIRDSADKLLKFNHICAPETLGQYTGLTDKNGAKIFEGDIVKYSQSLHEVVFCSRFGNAFFGIDFPERGEIWAFSPSVDAERMTVVGNIHDNPELIKEEPNDKHTNRKSKTYHRALWNTASACKALRRVRRADTAGG